MRYADPALGSLSQEVQIVKHAAKPAGADHPHLLRKERMTIKISRSNVFAHVVPKKKTDSRLKGAWLLWVVAGLMITAFVLLPPKIKLIIGHRVHHDRDLHDNISYIEPAPSSHRHAKGNTSEALSVAALLEQYGADKEWVILGTDKHICGVVQAAQKAERKVTGFVPKNVTCGEPGDANYAAVATLPTNVTEATGKPSSKKTALPYDVALIVGGTATKWLGAEPPRGKAKQVLELVAREAVGSTKKELILLEPDVTGKGTKQQWADTLTGLGCKRDKAVLRDLRKAVSEHTVKLYTCGVGSS